MVRQGSAKPLYGGSIPPQASSKLLSLCRNFYIFISHLLFFQARVVELVYTHDLKSCGEIHAGSIPAPGTTITFDLLFYSFHSWIESSRFVSEIFRKFILSQNLITKCAAAHFVIINKLVIINQS